MTVRHSGRPPSVTAIIEVVCEEFGVTHRLIISARRKRAVVEARHVAMWLATELTTLSYPAIGRLFHRDHSSVMYGIDRIEKRIANDPDLLARLGELAALVAPGAKASKPTLLLERRRA